MKRLLCIFLIILNVFAFMVPPSFAAECVVYSYVTFEETEIPLIISKGSSTFTYEDGALHIQKEGNTAANIANAANTSGYDEIMVSYRLKLTDLQSSFYLCLFKSEDGTWSNNAQVANGVLKDTKSGDSIYTFSKDSWTKVDFAIDKTACTYDVYVDGILKKADIAWQNAFDEEIAEIRLEVPAATVVSDFYVDDHAIYSGREICDVSADDVGDFPPSSILPSDDEQKELLKNTKALHIKSGVFFDGENKKELAGSGYVDEDGNFMIPLSWTEAVFGAVSSYTASNGKIKIGNNAQLQNTTLVVGTTVHTLDKGAEITGGNVYIPLKSIAEKAFSLQISTDNSCVNGGMAVLGDGFTFPTDSAGLEKLNKYLFFPRYSSDDMLAGFQSSDYSGIHPRIYTDSYDMAELLQQCVNNEKKDNWKNKIIAGADALIGADLPEYELYDGVRMTPIPAKNAQLHAGAYLLTGEKKYADASYAIIEEMCSWPDWNPDKEFLNTAEIASNIATAYDWIYSALSDGQKTVIEEALYEKGLYEAKKWWFGLKGPRDKWQIAQTNWNPVCNSSMAVVSIALMDVYPEEASEMLSLCTRGLEYISHRFADGGAWLEGPAYWEFSLRHLTRFIDACRRIFGTAFSVDEFEGLDETADIVVYQQTDIGTYNFSDSDVEQLYPTFIFRLATLYGNEYVSELVYDKNMQNFSASENAMLGLLWYDDSVGTSFDLPLDKQFGGDGAFGVMRQSFTEPNSAFVGMKAGKAVYNHSHLDLGSFIYEANGVRWAKELGRESYLVSDYWDSSQKRWQYLRTRAQGHNTLIINPDDSGIDMNLNATADFERFESGQGSSISVVDMTQALSDNASSAKRGFYFTDNRQSLVIRDEVMVNKESTLHWIMYTEASISDITDNSAVLTYGGKQLKLEYECSSDATLYFEDAISLEGTPLPEGQNANRGTKRVRLQFNADGAANITVKLTPVGIYASDISCYDTSLSRWDTAANFELLPNGDPEINMSVTSGVAHAEAVMINPDLENVCLYLAVYSGDELTELTPAFKEDGASEIKTSLDIGENTDVKIKAILIDTKTLRPLCECGEY